MSYWKVIKPYLKSLVELGKGRDTVQHARRLLKRVYDAGGTDLALRRVTALYTYAHKTYAFEKLEKKYAGEATRFENTPLQFHDWLGLKHSKSQFRLDNTWDFSRRVFELVERDNEFYWRCCCTYGGSLTNPRWLYGRVWNAIIEELRFSKEWENKNTREYVPLSNPYGIINCFRPFFDAVAREAALELAKYVRPENWSN